MSQERQIKWLMVAVVWLLLLFAYLIVPRPVIREFLIFNIPFVFAGLLIWGAIKTGKVIRDWVNGN